MNTAPHLNRSKVKQTALDLAGQTRLNGTGQPRFTRVSASFVERIEAAVRNAIKSEVIGKTLQ